MCLKTNFLGNGKKKGKEVKIFVFRSNLPHTLTEKQKPRLKSTVVHRNLISWRTVSATDRKAIYKFK